MQTTLLGKDFISTEDWSVDQLNAMLNMADDLKRRFACGELHDHILRSKDLFMLFFEESTRTRNSFEAGMAQLGGHAIYLTPSATQVGHGESAKDTGMVLERYGHGIALRDCRTGVGQAYQYELAKHIGIPVISMQDDVDHPCQAMADLMTIREKFGNDLRGRKFVISWTYAPKYVRPLSVPQALIMLMTRFGMDVTLAHPKGFEMMPKCLESAKQHAAENGTKFEVIDSMDDSFKDADIIYAKSWGPIMVTEDPKEVQAMCDKHKDWVCDERRMALTKRNSIYMHCMPIDRGYEATDAVIDGPHSVIYDEAENRLHIQKALMALTMGGKNLMNKQRLIAFTQELIRERSVSGEEQAVVARLVAEMKALAFDEVWVDEYGSALGVIKGQKPGKTLLLDGHCDIVDARAEDWKHDPFAAVIDNGYLYGRGVADMKGSLAAMIHAASSVDRIKLAGKIVISATVLEEVMEGGTLHHVMNVVNPDAVIIGESTNFTLNRAGRGRAEIVVETIGKSAHSSSPQAGLCAVHEMIRLMQAVEAVPMPSHPAMGSAQICLTDIVSEPFPGHSVVPNRCRVSYDRRLVPGETPESVLAGIQALPELKDIQYTMTVLDGEEKTYTGRTLKGLKFFPAWVFEEDHPLVAAALNGLRSSNFEPRLGSFGFCTNGAYSAGIAGVPTIGFGPGTELDAHTVNERMKVSDIERAADGYLGMIQTILA